MWESRLGEYTVAYENSEEFHLLKQEIFSHNIYYFETENPSPFIIDAGAHIGLSTLYFKKLYPAARVVAFEPNPYSFALLAKNVAQNQLENVELHQTALSNQSGTQAFYLDQTPLKWWSTSGFLKGAWNQKQQSQELQVKTLPLSRFLDQPVEFLKLDIEGAEQTVLKAAASKLHHIKQMMIEFHPHSQQSLPRLVEFLGRQHFRVTLWQDRQEVTVAKAEGLVLVEAQRS